MMKNKPITILLADDDPDDVEFLQQAFLKLDIGIRFQVAADGLQAIRYLESCTEKKDGYPDFIILDINMPRLNGIDTLTVISAHPAYQHIPVFMHTTSNEPAYIQNCAKLGAKGFFTKPFHHADISKVAGEMLENFKALKKGVAG